MDDFPATNRFAMHEPDPTKSQRSAHLLDVLAVFGSAHTAALATVAGQEISAETASQLLQTPGVSAKGDGYAFEPDAAATYLTQLMADNPTRYRLAHQIVCDHLYGFIRDGHNEIETQYRPIVERLANFLLIDFDRFAALIDAIDTSYFQERATLNVIRFFQAVWLRKTEQFDAALRLFDTLLADTDLDPSLYGRCLNSRAATLERLARFEDAVLGYHASIDWWQQRGNPLRIGIAQMNLGSLYFELQAYDDGEALLRQAIENFQRAQSLQWLAAAQHELALFYRNRGQWVEALDAFEAVRVRRQAEQADEAVGQTHSNIGELHMFRGDFDDALHHLHLGLQKMSMRIFHIDVWLDIGLTHQSMGRVQEAAVAYGHAAEIAQRIGRTDILPRILYRQGELARHQGKFDEADALYRQAIDEIESVRQPIASEALRISILGRWQQVYEALVLLCLEQGAVADAFQWAERARARAFAEAIMQDGIPEIAVDPVTDVGALQRTLSAETTVLCYLTTGVLARDIPLLRHIAPDNPLRQHLLTEAKTLRFTVTRDTIQLAECPIDPNHLATSVTQNAPVERMLHARMRRRLAHLLLPSDDTLQNAKQLIIVPHGPLHGVPFCALADNVPVSYAPSATLLQRHSSAPRTQSTKMSRALAVAYDGARAEHTLHFTAAEATFMAAATGGRAILDGQAEPTTLAEQASEARWIHFACHGTFLSDDPLASYLQIGPETRLTARDVLAAWQLQAELVTLSACLSGTSKVLRGDEPLGLVRAFLTAGARAVMVTQWEVDDLATYVLMRYFYGALVGGRSGDRARALRNAQDRVRHLTLGALQQELRAWGVDELVTLPDASAESRPFEHPRYWAAFILIM